VGPWEGVIELGRVGGREGAGDSEGASEQGSKRAQERAREGVRERARERGSKQGWQRRDESDERPRASHAFAPLPTLGASKGASVGQG
jgi:hypothetical protein